PEGSSGVKGMLMSIFAAPIFAASLIATVLRLPAKFVVTPKGLSSSADHILTFRRHLQWALLLVGAIVLAVVQGYAAPAVLLWPAVALAACLAPPVLCLVERIVGRQPAIDAAPVLADGRSGITTETLERAALDALLAAGSTTRRSHHPEGAGAADPSRPRPAAVPVAGDLPAGWVRTSSLAGRERRHAAEDARGVDPSPSPVPRVRPRPTPKPAQPGQPSQPAQPVRPAAARPSGQPQPGPAQPGQPQPGQPGQPAYGQPQPGQPQPQPQPSPLPRPVGRPPVPGPVPPASRPPAAPGAPGTPPPGARPRPTPTPAPRPGPAAAPGRPVERPAAAEAPRYVAPGEQGVPPGPLWPEARPAARAGSPDTRGARPTPPSPMPRPDAGPARGPRPGPRRTTPPMLLTSAAELEADRRTVAPVSVGSSGGNETATRHDERDGGADASDAVAVNAPTVAVRVVALAAVAGPALHGPDGERPHLDGRRTEAS
ncbi:MAG TPA: hypothetical protein VNP37_12225, partial [Actinomycetospora sp.]|nr:hypothetical protein [Actinomycetospora sp.]